MDNDVIDAELEAAMESLQPKVSHNHEKRQARRKQTAEDFTPATLVNEMLDKLPKDQWIEDKTFCDPACGNGNMLVEVLKRKLSKGHNYLKAIKTIYGTDIMEDNTTECRLRLFKIIANHLRPKTLSESQEIELVKILGQNIIPTRLSDYPNGSLDYHFDFNRPISDETAKIRLNNMRSMKLLDTVSE